MKREQDWSPLAGQADADGAPEPPRLYRDRLYKLVFQCAEPVEHLIRFVLSGLEQGQEWLDRMDFPSLQPLPTETVDPWLKAGYQDIAWRLKVRSPEEATPEWLRLLILVEFQSTVEYDMALRVQGYMQRMHEQAWRQRRVRRADRLPPVLAVVFYNGTRPWRAERSVWGLTEKRALRERDRKVKRMPVGMRYELVDVGRYAGKPLSQDNMVDVMLAAELVGKDLKEPSKPGKDLDPAAIHSILEALRRLLGSPDQRKVRDLMLRLTRSTIARAGVDLEVLEDWETMQEMQESGRMLTYLEKCAQGYQAALRAEGRSEALQDHRINLCRQAQRKFGAVAAADLARRVESIDDAAPLWEIGDLIIDCSDAGEFAARLREIE